MSYPTPLIYPSLFSFPPYTSGLKVPSVSKSTHDYYSKPEVRSFSLGGGALGRESPPHSIFEPFTVSLLQDLTVGSRPTLKIQQKRGLQVVLDDTKFPPPPSL